MEYQYKVIPFIGQSRGSLSAEDVAKQLEATINEYASQGWEFYQLSDVNIEVQPGCIGGLFGAKVQYVRFDQLIFRSDHTPKKQLHRQTATQNRGAHTSESVARTAPVHDDDETRNNESRTRPTLAITSKHLEVWQRKSDDEVRRAAASLNDYTEEGRQVILAELTRRSLEPFDDEEQGEEIAVSSFCYHCGTDVPVGAPMCAACGKSL